MVAKSMHLVFQTSFTSEDYDRMNRFLIHARSLLYDVYPLFLTRSIDDSCFLQSQMHWTDYRIFTLHFISRVTPNSSAVLLILVQHSEK